MKNIRAFLLLILLWPLGTSADARVLLKPNGRNAIPLRLKAMTARVEIEKQFATTTTIMTFGNEIAARIEADFLYEAPPRAVVTSFAYWYGDEKVVARVVEKERAREIYRSITSRMRDPALIEMIGKNTFRARIFPVMPNADLRVEITAVETLPSTPKGCEYSLPLKPEVAGKGTLENLDVTVRVAQGAMIRGVGNNLALPVARDKSGAAVMRLSQKNFRPTQDLKIGVTFQKPPLRALMLAAPSGGRDGFFALALTSHRDVSQPKLRFEGADVYDVLPQKLPPIKAGREILIVGRYRGASTRKNARVILGGELEAPIAFSSQRRDNNLATKLWAAERIETLSASTRRDARAQVVTLSQRFTLPSKYTSWLAIPEEERARYKTEKARADMSYYARIYGNEVRAGRRNGRVARNARGRLAEAAKSIGADSNEKLAQHLSQIASEWSYLRRPKNERELRSLQREIEALASVVPRAYRARVLAPMADVRRSVYENRLRKIASEWSQLVATNKAQTSQARRLQRQAKQLEARIGPQSNYLIYGLQEKLSRVADSWAREKYGARPNASRVAALDAQIERLAATLAPFKKSIDAPTAAEARRHSERNLLYPQMLTLSRQIVAEEKAFSPDEKKLADLRVQTRDLAKNSSLSLEEARKEALQKWAWKYREFASLWARAKYAERPDAQKVTYYKRLVEEANALHDSGISVEYILERAGAEEIWRLVAPFYSERENEMAKPLPDEAKLADLEKRIESLLSKTNPAEKTQAIFEEGDGWRRSRALQKVLENLRGEHDKANPDARLIAQLEARVLALQPFDFEYSDSGWPHNARPKVAPEIFAKWRTERIAVRAQKNKTQNGPQRNRLASREETLKVRMGDPLIAVDAPADALRVVAILPDGTIKNLRYELAARRWEARFDVPEYSQQGAHEIIILIVQKSGARRRLTMRFNVDVTAPRGAGTARDVSTESAKKWRLEMRGEADTARVTALLPWNARVELEPSSQDKTLFFAVVAPPPGFNKAPRVTFILTDRAHNRAQITVDLSP